MPLADQHDTIAAIASARGPAERGVVRIAGPKALAVVERLGAPSFSLSAPKLLDSVELRIELAGQPRPLPCDLFVWPDERSYTKQPSVEIHTVGSSPLLEALLQACLAVGARLAEPGEFTLRAFLAGRLDLVQAEAVLAVIDAHHTGALETALSQLAGGLSGPLHTLRSELLGLLADLEAGLDFVEEEDVRFVEQEELARRLEEAREIIEQAIEQTTTRGDATHRPRVVIAGAPNVGKSSLFNNTFITSISKRESVVYLISSSGYTQVIVLKKSFADDLIHSVGTSTQVTRTNSLSSQCISVLLSSHDVRHVCHFTQTHRNI